jgi:signal transduction histidine kinase
MASREEPLTRRNDRETRWAFVLTVAAGYVYVLIAARDLFPPVTLAASIGLGIAYCAWSFLNHSLERRFGWRAGASVYYAVSSLLVIVIQWLGRGNLWLVMMPLIAQAVFELPRPAWLSLVAVMAGLAFLVPLKLAAGTSWSVLLSNSITFAPAVIFVIVFSRVWAREHAARAEVERLAAALGEANRKLREYAAQAEELATAKERNRLAREIHDTLGHYLTVINVQLEAAQAVMEVDRARSGEAVAKAQALAKDGLAEVRRSVAALRASPVESRPLAEAIAALAEECRAGGLIVDYQVQGVPRRLTLPAETALYRVAQEALTNVRKHARASRVDLRLDYAALDEVRLAVHDNGVGAKSPDDTEGRFGLVGMRERIHLLGGEVRIVTKPGQGFTLEVEVPGEG